MKELINAIQELTKAVQEVNKTLGGELIEAMNSDKGLLGKFPTADTDIICSVCNEQFVTCKCSSFSGKVINSLVN